MMATRVLDHELRGADGAQRLVALARAAAGRPNGEIADLDRAIVALEGELAMDLAAVRRALADGTLEETRAVMELLMLDRRRSLLRGQ